MSHIRWKNIGWLGLVLILLLLDQWTKYSVMRHLQLLQPKAILPGLNLTLVYNTGAAFSLLHAAGGWARWLLSGIAVCAVVLITLWMLYLPARHRLLALGLSCILAGTIGNLLNRLVLGYVIDFIDVYVGQWHWPAFNLADSVICIGVVLLCVASFRHRK